MKNSLILMGFSLFVFFGSKSTLFGMNCQKMTTPSDLLQCTLAKDPILLEGQAMQQIADTGVSKAGQSPNPKIEFTSEGVGSDNTRQEFGYVHPVELGGAKNARILIAKAEQQYTSFEAKRRMALVTLKVARNIYRLRQVKKQLLLAGENITSFENLVTRFKKIRGLNAEQKISATAYRFALQEVLLLQHRLYEEQRQLEMEFVAIHGAEFKINQNLLPQAVTKWPELDQLPLQSPELGLANANISLAEGQIKDAEASTWGELEIAPSMVQETENGINSSSISIRLSMPLSIYQSNKAGILQARLQKESMVELAKFKKQELNANYRRSREDYKQMQRQWMTLPSIEEVEAQHDELHKDMKRGALPASLVIEIHRQLQSLLEQRHALELDGITHLIQIKAMQNKLSEFTLP